MPSRSSGTCGRSSRSSIAIGRSVQARARLGALAGGGAGRGRARSGWARAAPARRGGRRRPAARSSAGPCSCARGQHDQRGQPALVAQRVQHRAARPPPCRGSAWPWMRRPAWRCAQRQDARHAIGRRALLRAGRGGTGRRRRRRRPAARAARSPAHRRSRPGMAQPAAATRGAPSSGGEHQRHGSPGRPRLGGRQAPSRCSARPEERRRRRPRRRRCRAGRGSPAKRQYCCGSRSGSAGRQPAPARAPGQRRQPPGRRPARRRARPPARPPAAPARPAAESSARFSRMRCGARRRAVGGHAAWL